MKIRRTLSGLLFGLGCAIMFIGALSLLLPRVDNPQLKVFLASFEALSRSAVINHINRFMIFALSHSWQVLGVGALCLLTGGGLLFHFSESAKPAEDTDERFQRPASEPVPIIAEEPNPFAVAEHSEPEDFASKLLAYQRPLLDENRIDENLPHLPSSFAGESAAILTERGDESPSGARTILRTPQTFVSPSEEAVRPAPAPPQPSGSSEPSPMQNSQPATSRIRSTMGMHKQW